MKAVLLSLVVTFAGSLSFAMSVPQARIAVVQITSETNQLVGTCGNISPPARRIKHQLADLGAGLNSFVETPNIEDALKNIQLAINAVNLSLVECVSDRGQDDSDAQNLLEMYLDNIDINLMIEQHGIGVDGRRKRSF